VFDRSASFAEHFAIFFALQTLAFSDVSVQFSICSAFFGERCANGYASRVMRQAIRWSMIP
jgi:hypothetical protein